MENKNLNNSIPEELNEKELNKVAGGSEFVISLPITVTDPIGTPCVCCKQYKKDRMRFSAIDSRTYCEDCYEARLSGT